MTLCREVNERIRELAGAVEVSTTGSIRYLCECGEQDCLEAIELTDGEYEALRQDRAVAVVARGHEHVGERVVERTDRFSVVAALSEAPGDGVPSAANLEAVLAEVQLRAEAIRQELADQAREVRHRPRHGLQDPASDAA